MSPFLGSDSEEEKSCIVLVPSSQKTEPEVSSKLKDSDEECMVVKSNLHMSQAPGCNV